MYVHVDPPSVDFDSCTMGGLPGTLWSWPSCQTTYSDPAASIPMSSWMPKYANPQFGAYGHFGPPGAEATRANEVLDVPARVRDTR